MPATDRTGRARIDKTGPRLRFTLDASAVAISSGSEGIVMAQVCVEVALGIGVDEAWDVFGDFAGGPARMAPGLVVASRADGRVREVRFVDGLLLTERLVTRDDADRRIVYGMVGEPINAEHDNAAMQVLADGPGRSRMVWTRDVLPDALAAPLRTSMERAVAAIEQAWGRG
jgi:hypothetical protein